MHHFNNSSPYCQCQRCPCCGKIVNQFTGNQYSNTEYGYGSAGGVNGPVTGSPTTTSKQGGDKQ